MRAASGRRPPDVADDVAGADYPADISPRPAGRLLFRPTAPAATDAAPPPGAPPVAAVAASPSGAGVGDGERDGGVGGAAVAGGDAPPCPSPAGARRPPPMIGRAASSLPATRVPRVGRAPSLTAGAGGPLGGGDVAPPGGGRCWGPRQGAGWTRPAGGEWWAGDTPATAPWEGPRHRLGRCRRARHGTGATSGRDHGAGVVLQARLHVSLQLAVMASLVSILLLMSQFCPLRSRTTVLLKTSKMLLTAHLTRSSPHTFHAEVDC